MTFMLRYWRREPFGNGKICDRRVNFVPFAKLNLSLRAVITRNVTIGVNKL